MTKYLDLKDLTRIAARLLDCEQPPVRDWGLLESAAMRPKTSLFGADAYPTPHEKVAALMHSVARNHTLVDGNKRLAFMAAYVMYAFNGYDLVPPSVDEGDAVIQSIARGELDVGEIAEIMSTWAHATAG